MSISQLKTNPAKALRLADDTPLTILNRNQIAGYLLSPDVYEALVEYIENSIDTKAVEDSENDTSKPLEETLEKIGL